MTSSATPPPRLSAPSHHLSLRPAPASGFTCARTSEPVTRLGNREEERPDDQGRSAPVQRAHASYSRAPGRIVHPWPLFAVVPCCHHETRHPRRATPARVVSPADRRCHRRSRRGSSPGPRSKSAPGSSRSALVAHGVETGDRVAVIRPKGHESFEAVHAVLRPERSWCRSIRWRRRQRREPSPPTPAISAVIGHAPTIRRSGVLELDDLDLKVVLSTGKHRSNSLVRHRS